MKVRRFAAPYVVIVSAIWLPKLVLGGTPLYTHLLRERVLAALGGALKIVSLFAGAFAAGASAKKLERGNPARVGWALFACWLAGFGSGQIVLSSYAVILGRTPPLPSAGDALFLAGYAAMILGLAAFIHAYRSAGFATGSGRALSFVGAGSALGFGALGFPVLGPIAATPQPVGELLINLAYPLLDLVALVATLMLLWITRGFRGGKVWTLWATLLASIVFMAAGDILFGYVSSIGHKGFEPIVDLMFVVGYFLAACGAKLELELLTE